MALDNQRKQTRDLLECVSPEARAQIAAALSSRLWPSEVDVTDLISAVNAITPGKDTKEEIQRVLEREKKRALRSRERQTPYVSEWHGADGSENDVRSETGLHSEAPERAYTGGQDDPVPDLEKLTYAVKKAATEKRKKIKKVNLASARAVREIIHDRRRKEAVGAFSRNPRPDQLCTYLGSQFQSKTFRADFETPEAIGEIQLTAIQQCTIGYSRPCVYSHGFVNLLVKESTPALEAWVNRQRVELQGLIREYNGHPPDMKASRKTERRGLEKPLKSDWWQHMKARNVEPIHFYVSGMKRYRLGYCLEDLRKKLERFTGKWVRRKEQSLGGAGGEVGTEFRTATYNYHHGASRPEYRFTGPRPDGHIGIPRELTKRQLHELEFLRSRVSVTWNLAPQHYAVNAQILPHLFPPVPFGIERVAITGRTHNEQATLVRGWSEHVRKCFLDSRAQWTRWYFSETEEQEHVVAALPGYMSATIAAREWPDDLAAQERATNIRRETLLRAVVEV